METETQKIRVVEKVGTLSKAFGAFAESIQSATQATEKLNETLGKVATRRKARWPIYPVRSRKQRLRRYRMWRRNIAQEMHRLQGDYIKAFVAGEKITGLEITKKSAAYLCEAVASFTVLRLFESCFSGESKHVLRALSYRLRKKRRTDGHPSFTRQSGHAALRYSLLARRDAERARLHKLQSAAGAGVGIIV